MPANLYGPMDAPRGVGLPAWHSAAEWEALAPSDRPTAYGDWYKFLAKADSTPERKRRSEIKPGVSLDAVKVQDGMLSHFEGWVMPQLGLAGKQTRNWHYVVQLIGPNFDGAFEDGSICALAVRDGRWRLEHGGLKWFIDLGAFVEGQALWVQIDVVLSERSDRGSVEVRMSPSNIGAPTMSGKITVQTWWHQYANWSCGLYRGSGNNDFSPSYICSDGKVGGPQPFDYDQTVFWKDIDIINQWPAAPSPSYGE